MSSMRLFAKNLRTFLLALALGVSVWVSAVSADDPNEVNTYPNPIPLEIVGLDRSLVITNDIPRTVEVRLRAPRTVWETLIAREDAIRATLDLSGRDADVHRNLAIQLTISERPYQLVSVNPPAVTVNLEKLNIQTFPLVVSLTGQPAAGYQAGDATRDVTEVTVSGPESLVRQVARARVLINLDRARESID
jgi:YbbR domain-containing protein